MTLEIVSNHYDGMWHSSLHRLDEIYKEDGRINIKFPDAIYCIVYTITVEGRKVTKYLHYRSPDFRDDVYDAIKRSGILDPTMLYEPKMNDQEAFKLLPIYIKDPQEVSRLIVLEAVKRSGKRPEFLHVFKKLDRKYYDYTNLRILAMFSVNSEAFVKRCAITLRCPSEPVLRIGVTPYQFFKWITSPPRRTSE